MILEVAREVAKWVPSVEEQAALEDLQVSEEWKLLKKVLRRLEGRALSQLEGSNEVKDIWKWMGRLEAFKEVFEFIEGDGNG